MSDGWGEGFEQRLIGRHKELYSEYNEDDEYEEYEYNYDYFCKFWDFNVRFHPVIKYR